MHTPPFMKLRCLFLATLLIPVLAFAQSPVEVLKPFNYEQAAALARERIASNLDLNTYVIILGPVRNIETQTIDGKEITLSIPYCRAFGISEVRSPESLSRYMSFSDSGKSHLAVYHSNQSQPAVRIEGPAFEVRASQFPLKSGDVVVITDKGKQASGKK